MTALQDLPEGKKFFPYSVENPSEGILKTFSQVFSSEYRDAMEKVSSISIFLFLAKKTNVNFLDGTFSWGKEGQFYMEQQMSF